MSYHGLANVSQRGDPFIHRKLFGGIKGAVSGFISGGPLGIARGAARGFLTARKRARPRFVQRAFQTRAPTRTFKGIQIGGPLGARMGASTIRGAATAAGVPGEKRRRMNVANPKALRRAIRREQGFVKLARRALKGTGYAIVSKASRVKRMTIKEAGPGGVVVQ